MENLTRMENRVDHANPFTNQIFQEAVIRNDMAIVKLLLKYGIYPKRNERNRQGLTALQQCVLDGNGRMAILLLESGADIEAKTSNGWTCLHIASALGDSDILTTLVNHCCDLVALTKNEELPIDLAASRDIKIKLAKEMSRVGYSELAQWYMRKLAAREGVFYVLSTDTLLDLACDDKQERSNDYLYSVRQQREMFIHSPARKQDAFRLDVSPKKDMWMEYSAQEQMTYLTYSSGYLSEVVFDPTSGQYSKALTTSGPAPVESPQRKQILEEKISLASISEVDGAPPFDESKSRSGTLKRTSSNKRHSQNMSRKPSTIELHIDYSHTTESESEEEDDCAFENEPHDGGSYPFQQHNGGDHQNSLNRRMTTNNHESNSPGHTTTRTLERISMKPDPTRDEQGRDPPVRTSAPSSDLPPPDYIEVGGYNKTRNVKFNPVDTNNEFCNCPNCKKLGYAFSPDIQVGSRKTFHVPIKSSDTLPPGYNQFYYPETTTEKNALYFDQSGYDYKPRKRKKKLFSGIKSMFKDSIKVRTNMDSSPACDDAGILFSVSLRDKNKTKQIKQRQEVRRSNSFSGMESSYQGMSEEINVLSHSQVVAPPPKFSDLYQDREILESSRSHMEQSSQPAVYQRQEMHPGYQVSRNTYERREIPNGGLATGLAITDEILYYPDENTSAFCESTTLPHGFHFSRPAPAYQQQNQLQGRSYISPTAEHHHPARQVCNNKNCLDTHTSKISEAGITELVQYEYEGEIKTSTNENGKMADNCAFCSTPAPIAGALPVTGMIE